MKKRTIFILALIGAILISVVAWLLLRIPLVNSITLNRESLVTTLQFTGRMTSLSRVEVGSTLAGRAGRISILGGKLGAA
jgi:HlyD family secretion protein